MACTKSMAQLVEQLRAMSGPNRPNVVTTAADFIANMQWRSFEDEKPTNYSRVIVHRVIGQQSYVDVMNYIEEPQSGLKPLVDLEHIKHWMLLPEPPLQG
jgi:hypothetical protein